jgi:hypothetical protein
VGRGHDVTRLRRHRRWGGADVCAAGDGGICVTFSTCRLGKTGVWILAALIVSAAPAAAQDAPAVELGVGYQFLDFEESSSLPLGFSVDVSGALTDTFSWVGEVGWSRDSEELLGADFSFTALHFAGGARWSGRYSPRFTPFVQVLVGAQRSSYEEDGDDLGSNTDFLLQPGGGVAYSMGTWSIFGQVDYRRVFFEDEGVNGVRFVVGARVPLR